jgi:hypothetical protein
MFQQVVTLGSWLFRDDPTLPEHFPALCVVGGFRPAPTLDLTRLRRRNSNRLEIAQVSANDTRLSEVLA